MSKPSLQAIRQQTYQLTLTYLFDIGLDKTNATLEARRLADARVQRIKDALSDDDNSVEALRRLLEDDKATANLQANRRAVSERIAIAEADLEWYASQFGQHGNRRPNRRTRRVLSRMRKQLQQQLSEAEVQLLPITARLLMIGQVDRLTDEEEREVTHLDAERQTLERHVRDIERHLRRLRGDVMDSGRVVRGSFEQGKRR